MKYKVGDKVRIKSLDWYNKNKSKSHGTVACGDKYFEYDMKEWCGKTMTILEVYQTFYMMEEDWGKNSWTDEMIEGLVEKGTKVGTALNPIEPKSNANCLTQEMIEGLVEEETKPNIIEEAKTYWDSIKDAWICPNGYIFKDENGNVINATKIVLEKKKNNISLTQEQINIMVHESCVLFCKHCGCGVPRDTCTSLGTCDEHDEYKKHIRLYLKEKQDGM